MPRESKIGGAAARAQANRDAMAQRSRDQSAAVSDIGEIPEIVNLERRERCRLDLHAFLTTYFPQSTSKGPFGDDHIRMIGRIQRAITDGGLFLNLFFRGGAKSTITENAAIWAVAYGHRKFVPVFAAEGGLADQSIGSIKTELSQNDLLMGDFPEICYAIRKLDGNNQRCRSQKHKGKLTHISWTSDTIVLPTIDGSEASSSMITSRGITAASRGMRYKRADGIQQRPDFVLIDDPQTDDSASSDLQCNKRLGLILKNILKLGGHDRRVAVVINATVIQRGDLVDRLSERKKFPAWQVERVKMVKSWCTATIPVAGGDDASVHDRFWLGEYKRIRETFDAEVIGDQQRAWRDATAFYELNRAVMDEGCVVSWPSRFDADYEIGGIQHAYNMLIDDGPEVFASECQNEPLEPEVQNAAEVMTADQICEKVNNLARGSVPLSCSRIVAFIDVQKTVLYWTVAAFDDGFSGAVIDYGTWPDQGRTYFSAADIQPRKTIAAVTHADGLEAQIFSALESCTGELLSREWKREDGAVLKIERAAIDANWGESSDVIYEFCRRSSFAGVLNPSHGKYVGAISKPFREYAKKTGDRVGLNWRMPALGGRRVSRYVVFDTNFWKSFVQSRLSTDKGGRGSLSLFGTESVTHKLFADHLTSEQGTKVEAKGKSVIEWKLKPTRPDNHWLDCLVGCHVVASMQGVNLDESSSAAHRAIRRVVTFAEKQKTRRVFGANKAAKV